MQTRPRDPKYDAPEFKRLWFSKATLEAIARKYGVSIPSIHRAAMRRGFPSKYEVRTCR